ncbi:MAG TPA: membrane protein insertase YidC, partial [Gemmatales bacterium]|nr:membrane protein insertase YidC [Gemmatales bacterium]
MTVTSMVGLYIINLMLMKPRDPAQATVVAQQQASGTAPAGTVPAPEGATPEGATAQAKIDSAPAKQPEPIKPTEPQISRNDALDKLLQAHGEEKLHVLGNDATKLRVVFSDRGAAIRTITLNAHEASDRQTGQRLATDASGKRPRLVLVTDDEDKNRAKLQLHKQFELLSYRFGLLDDKEQVPAEGAVLPWKQVEGATSETVSYEAEIPERNLKVTKVFSLQKDTYHVDMELQFSALDNSKPTQFSYELSGPQGMPVEGLRWKGQGVSFRQYVFTTQDADKPTNIFRTLEGVERLKKDGTPNSFPLSDPKSRKLLLYGGVMIQFFASLAVVDHAPGELPPPLIDKVLAQYTGPDGDAPSFYADRQGRMTTRLISTPVQLEKGQPITHKYLLYAGPSKSLLLDYEEGTAPGLAKKYGEDLHLNQLTDATDFPNGPFRAMGITGLLVKSTNLMHRLLEWLYAVVRNYGVAIILMTVIVRLLLFPLSRKKAQNQAKMQEQMKILRPEMEKIKKLYANDRQQLAVAQMELFKKHGMSPLASCNGCWILFLQMPVFLGLYFALRESVHLRMANFLWIDNLAMPDMLLHWGDNFLTNITFFSFLYLGPYLHILPLISVGVMYAYQKLMAPPAMDEQQEQQIRMMNYMTLAMGLAFYWVASGLCIYFIVSSLWGMIERRFVKKAKEQAIARWQENREKQKDKKGEAKG